MEYAETELPIEGLKIDELLAARDAAQEAYFGMRNAFIEAQKKLLPFGVGLPRIAFTFGINDHRDLTDEQYDRAIRREIDRMIWVALFRDSQADTLMNSEARRALHEKLHESQVHRTGEDDDDGLPPVTAENIASTFADLHSKRGEFFEDCIESIFRSLSWNHKTNSPSAIGRKIIVEYAFYVQKREWQGDGTTLNGNERINDLERVICSVRGLPVPTYQTGIRALGELNYGEWHDVMGSDGETKIMRAKVYRKGTLHVEILCQDSIDVMNRAMGRRFPGSIPPPKGTKRSKWWTSHNRKPEATGARTVEERQAYYTPRQLALRVAQNLKIDAHAKILEPSAGTGNLVDAAVELGARPRNIVAVENDEEPLERLSCSSCQIRTGDFLCATPEDLGYFDAVLMNPPFSKGREVDHVIHAYEFLRPGGKLVSIMSVAAAQRDTGAYARWRGFLVSLDGDFSIERNPSGSFAESGANVETLTVTINKPDTAVTL